MNDLVLEATQLSKTYHEGIIQTSVFSEIDLSLYAGEKIAIIGASGSGKSTLLHVLAGLDTPDSGVVRLNSASFSKEGEAKRGRLRNQYMGFVYQFHHLLPELTALENVMMPLRIRRTDSAVAKLKAQKLLERVGLL